MKKVVSILAIAVMTFGFYSCTNDTAAAEEELISFTDDDHKEEEGCRECD